ncbi:glycosyltransferase [Propioniciclava soli]|uniref:Glycosyltransferase n=1 Tax=Propioniciclava soli TaxID=2775081 RepID=A0ABZ3CAM1_9ACTN
MSESVAYITPLNTEVEGARSLREVARVVFPGRGDVDAAALYVDPPRLPEQEVGGAPAGAATAATEEEPRPDDYLSSRSLRVRRGRHVSLGSYFNAFPASYWRWWTDVTAVVLRVVTSGDGTVIVYRSNARGQVQRVDSRQVAEKGAEHLFELTLVPFNDGGWYWFDLVGGEDGLVLEEASWLVEAGDVKVGTVNLGMTTFNRPDYAVANVRAIAASQELASVVHEMLVVDQGTELVEDEDDYAAAVEEMAGRLRVIRQGNMGGSGGYARGMYETLQADADGVKADYFMTLDDDIKVEPESILRAVTFADFCRVPSIVGSHMFDLHNRTLLNAFAEVIDPYAFRWGPPDGLGQLDLSERGLRSRRLLHRRWDADYNGWWMCLIPRVVLEEVGLALPVFIKWDDSEYSLRAREHGYPTVTLPGSAVWHVSWFDKDDAVDWQAYFHERNRLIAALLHSGFLKGGRMLRESLMVETKHTISMQYYAGRLVLDGLRDVLAGPDRLHDQIATAAARARGLKKEYVEAQVSQDIGALPAVRTAKPRKRQEAKPPSTPALIPWTLSTIVRQVALPPRELSRTYPEAAIRHADSKWYWMPRFDSALVTNADGTGASLHQRDPAQVRALTWESVRLHAELARRWEALAKEYRDALPRITSPESWAETFARNPAPASPR